MGEKKKALVVDDNQNFRQLLQYALEDDFEVFTAGDGLEGARTAMDIRPDIILMDVMMPNMSGIELSRLLTAEEETRNIPVIVLTGSKLDSGTPDLFKQERNVKLFLSKTTPVMDILAAAKSVLGLA